MGRFILKIVLWLFLLSKTRIMAQTCKFYQELILGQEYYIYSPNYPENYPGGTNCIWDLRTVYGTKIFLSCNVLNIPKSPNCNGDKLSVSPTGNANFYDATNYCGRGSLSFISQGPAMKIGLFSLYPSKGGQFFCTATTIFDTTTKSPLQSNDGLYNCQCGWKATSRIVGGQETDVHEFPFMAALIYKEKFWCGSNIISDRFLLSAAHCVLRHDASDHFILVGDQNLLSGNDTEYSALYKVDAYEIHPDYDETYQRNDIAILRTATKIVFSNAVGPICLPFRYTAQDFAGQQVLLLGWGQTEFSGSLANTLLKVQVDVLSNLDCSRLQSEAITEGEMCTYSKEYKDSCQNDSGGPLLWIDPSNKLYQLLGLISHGVGCGSASPSINTRVTEYLEWIIKRTGDTNYCVK